jgi:hypothetical protein
VKSARHLITLTALLVSLLISSSANAWYGNPVPLPYYSAPYPYFPARRSINLQYAPKSQMAIHKHKPASCSQYRLQLRLQVEHLQRLRALHRDLLRAQQESLRKFFADQERFTTQMRERQMQHETRVKQMREHHQNMIKNREKKRDEEFKLRYRLFDRFVNGESA